jgi:autotransporter-associated beta strand protein
MSAGIKANNDGSGAIQIGGSDYITISSAGAVAIPQTLAVTGTSTFTGATTLTGGVAGDFKMNSGYGSVATAYGCRAWVNFNGTGTVAIRASGNVSSITDQGVGRYRVNLTNAMPDTNYVTVGSVLNSTTPAVNAVAWLVGSDDSGATAGSYTTTSFQIGTFQSVATAWDPQYVQAAIFR